MTPRRLSRAAAHLAVTLAVGLLATGCTPAEPDAVTRGSTAVSSLPPPAATSSSSASGSSADALADRTEDLGEEWTASPDDTAPWVQITWSARQSISSVQVFGPTEDAFDPGQSAAAALYGTLEFSDGSSVDVPGIAAGAGMPSTVAFTARSTTSVRLTLEKQISSAVVGLRELSAYPTGVTPPVWPSEGDQPTYAVTPAAATCASDAPVAAARSDRLTLACPAPGSAVEGAARVVVGAPADSLVTLALPRGHDGATPPLSQEIAVDARGRATFDVDVSGLAQGPFALTVAATSAGGEVLAPLFVQLFHAAGDSTPEDAAAPPPSRKTLVFQDDFDEALSVTADGWGAHYAASKPEPWGGSQFGDAIFADPSWGADTLATLPGGFLRIRAQPIGDLVSKQTWGQQHASGIMSSQRFGGSGFSAQYGYFEARMLGAPGPGSWPAFWMFNSASGTARAGDTGGEVDAVELYGHDPVQGCHATHAWGAAEGASGVTECVKIPDGTSWASQWHTYGVQVLPGGAEFFVDGVSVATLDQLSHTDEPFYFMLNLALGGGWPIDLSATGDTTDLYVDWVRVYT